MEPSFFKALEVALSKHSLYSTKAPRRQRLYIITNWRVCSTGRQLPLSPLFCTGSFLKDVPYWPHNYSLEKNQVPRELTLIAISLTFLVAQWYSYGGSWKWVTILPILIGILMLLFSICFCIPSHVKQQLLSLDCQNFVRYSSLVFFYLSWELSLCRVSFLKGDLQFSKNFKNTICIGLCKLKCTEKRFIPFIPLHFLLSLSPMQNLKEDLNMPPGMYSTINLLEIMRLSAVKSPLFYPSSYS